ncbi:MAG: hypothetical protein ACK5JH_17260 [Anaerocolumna sp.]
MVHNNIVQPYICRKQKVNKKHDCGISRLELSMSEKIYITMKSVGVWNLVIGILLIIAGIASGVLMIIGGGKLLKKKSEILF